MDSMDGKVPGPLKPRLLGLALMAQGQAQQPAFTEKLSGAERAALGAPDAWTCRVQKLVLSLQEVV